MSAEPPNVSPKPTTIYPYVVPAEYLAYGTRQPDGMTRDLGHGLYVVLVQDLNGMVENVRPQDLTALGLTGMEAQRIADANLGALIHQQEVKSTVFPKGPQGRPFALFGGHWAAASCITWSGLFAAVSKALGSEKLLVCVPHREAMLVFPLGDVEYISAMTAMIREKESDGRKPLSMELFELTKDGVKPFESKG